MRATLSTAFESSNVRGGLVNKVLSQGAVPSQPTHLPRAVLWDMDGTLLDSVEYHLQAWQDAITAAGRAYDRAHFTATFGQCNDSILRSLLGPDASAAEIARISDDKEARYRKLVLASDIRPLPGVTRWLAALRGAGWRQAIASSAPRANIEAVLAALPAMSCGRWHGWGQRKPVKRCERYAPSCRWPR